MTDIEQEIRAVDLVLRELQRKKREAPRDIRDTYMTRIDPWLDKRLELMRQRG